MARSSSATTEQERPLGQLIGELTQDLSGLIRKEMELARTEFAEKGKQYGLGAGLGVASGVLGLMALGALTAALILGLAELVPAWASALIVAAIYGGIAAAVALSGKQKIQSAGSPAPTRAFEDLRETKEEMQSAWQQSRQTS